MKYLLILFCLTIYECLLAEPDQPVATINNYEEEFIISSKSRAIRKLTRTVTVFNEEGDQYAQPYVIYDKFIKVRSFECQLSDLNGNLLKKFKNSDVSDESLTSAGTIYDDNRVKYFSLEKNKYPYQVTTKYEVEYNGLFHYPSFRPVPGYEVSVDHSQFKVSAPLDLGIRFKANYLDSLPSVEKDDNQINYTWNFDHLELIKEEILSPPEEEILPIVYLAANQFEYDGYAGSMDSWNTFGKWLYDLLPHESFLSTQEKQTIHTIAASNNSTEDKIRALYEYLQSKTRYVSVQLGIGGYQPMAADKVSELGYGDCKALSNYMRVILEEAGIPSFYTIIGGGRNHSSFSFTDFPNGFQANHVILSVPLSTDTVFLECTSQKNPYGYLGSFTGNRNALMVSEQGGQLIKTTSYDLDDYLIKRREHLILNPDGSLEGNAKTLYHGVAFENVEGKQDESKEDARMEFLKKIDVPGFNLKSINYQYTQAPVPEMTEEVFFNIDQYAQSSNDRIFFKPNLFSRWTFQLPKDDHRTQPIVINQPIYQVDSLVIDLPNEYMSEALIEPVDLHSDFGVFKVETILKDNQLHLVRQLEIYQNRYAQDSYQDLRDFFKKIWKADKASVVLIKKKT